MLARLAALLAVMSIVLLFASAALAASLALTAAQRTLRGQSGHGCLDNATTSGSCARYWRGDGSQIQFPARVD
jgi:hypothetical protein